MKTLFFSFIFAWYSAGVLGSNWPSRIADGLFLRSVTRNMVVVLVAAVGCGLWVHSSPKCFH